MITRPMELMEGLSDELAGKMLHLAQKEDLPAGTLLFRLGEEAQYVYVVERGRIRLSLPIRIRGKEEDLLVEEMSPGETVGWSALIAPYRFTLNATALSASSLLAWPRAAMEEFFSQHPDAGHMVARNLATVIGHRLQKFQTMWLREVQRSVEMQYR